MECSNLGEKSRLSAPVPSFYRWTEWGPRSGVDLPKVSWSTLEPRLQQCGHAWWVGGVPADLTLSGFLEAICRVCHFLLINVLINHGVPKSPLSGCYEPKYSKEALRHPQENTFQAVRAWPELGMCSLLGRVLIFHLIIWFQGLTTASGTQLVLCKCMSNCID